MPGLISWPLRLISPPVSTLPPQQSLQGKYDFPTPALLKALQGLPCQQDQVQTPQASTHIHTFFYNPTLPTSSLPQAVRLACQIYLVDAIFPFRPLCLLAHTALYLKGPFMSAVYSLSLKGKPFQYPLLSLSSPGKMDYFICKLSWCPQHSN